MNLSRRLSITSLSQKNEIIEIFRNGKKISTNVGPVYFYDNKNVKNIKAAILIKKKIGNACYRNYVKRMIRYYINSDFTLLKKYNRVIFLYSLTKPIKYEELKREYNSLLI
jgi:ribonuclease P protein component